MVMVQLQSIGGGVAVVKVERLGLDREQGAREAPGDTIEVGGLGLIVGGVPCGGAVFACSC